MSNSDRATRIWQRTARSKAALDAAKALKKYHELIESGVDKTTAFLQVFMSIYYLIPPEPPRPDYISTVAELHSALKEAYSHFSQLKEEAEDNLKFLETLLSENPNR